MATITVHKRTKAWFFNRDIARDVVTSVPVGSYETVNHYIKANGLEVAWVRPPGFEDSVALTWEEGDPRTWESDSPVNVDYRAPWGSEPR